MWPRSGVVLHTVGQDHKAIFEEYAGEHAQVDHKQIISKLKLRKFSHLVLFLHFTFRIERNKCNINVSLLRMPDVEILLDARPASEEVMQLLESETSSTPESDPDIPALREQFAILVFKGKAKEAIGVLPTYEQRKRLDDDDV